MGVQVNAVTKSGTNTPSGTFAGYFRDDKLNARIRAEPGPPCIRTSSSAARSAGRSGGTGCTSSRNYEYEREPQSYVYDSPYPAFDMDLMGTRKQYTGGHQGRHAVHAADAVVLARHQLSPVDSRERRRRRRPIASASTRADRYSPQTWAQFTQVLEQPRGQRNQGRLLREQERASRHSIVGSKAAAFPIVRCIEGTRGILRRADRPAIRCAAIRSAPPTNAPQMHRAGHLADPRRLRVLVSTRSAATTCGWAASSCEHMFHHWWCSTCNGNLDATRRGSAGGGRCSPRCSRSGTTRRRGTCCHSARARSASGSRSGTTSCSRDRSTCSAGVVAGRLGADVAPDAEPRAQVRRGHRGRGRTDRAAAVDGAGTAARARRLRPAARLRVPGRRSDGHCAAAMASTSPSSRTTRRTSRR